MASGNLESLFVSLGIRDEMSSTLKKIVDGMKGVDEATNKARKQGEELVNKLNSVKGDAFVKVFKDASKYIEENAKGVSGIVSALVRASSDSKNGILGKILGAKDLADISRLLNVINSELAKMPSQSKEDKAAIKAWQSRIANALSYIQILRDVESAQSKIARTKSDNPNVDTAKLKAANDQLSAFKKNLLGLVNMGGIDNSNVLSYYRKLSSILKGMSNETISLFKKDNTISVFNSNFDKVDSTLSRVEDKLRTIVDLKNEGLKKGYNTSMLDERILGLGNKKTLLETALLNKNGELGNNSELNKTLSSTAAELSKVNDATRWYGREKGKIIAQEREHNKAVSESNKSVNDASIAYNKLGSILRELNGWHGRGLNILGVDATNDIRKSLSVLSSYQSTLEQIRMNGGRHHITGMTAKELLGSADYVNAISDAKLYAKEVKQSIKEVEQAKEDAKRKADEQRRIDNGEVAYYAKIRDILSQIDAIEKGMTPFLNATANKNMTFPSHLVDDLKKLYSVQQTLLANNHAGRNMGLDWLKDFQNRNGLSQIVKELKDFMSNADEARKRYVRLFDVLNSLRNTRAQANIAGVDTSKIDSQIASTLAALRELRTIMQTGIGDAKGVVGSDSRSITLASRINKEVQEGIRLERQRQQEIAKSAAKVQADLVRGFEKANSSAGKLNSTIQDLKSLFLQGGLVFGAQQFAMSIITTGGEMEKQHIALQSILGDMQNANTLFGQIKELALNSPFTFSELNRDVKQLAAYGVEYDQLYDTTKRLADMSSGLGVSFDRIALAFGQVQARGWLDGKELRQIAYAGIPLLDKLSDFYSKQEGRKVSTSEIKTRISNREVSFDDVKNIFWQMTDAGGQFYNMQQTLSETLLGRYNKLKDAWEIMLADFASGKSVIGGTFMMAIDLVTKFVQSLHSLGPVVAAAFSGIALTRFTKSFGGNAGAAFLANKARMSDEMLRRRMSGEALSPYEQTNFIANRGRITTDDLKTLTRSGQLNKLETQRLYLSGRITTEQYKQTMEMLKQRGAMTGLNAQASMYSLSWRKVGLSIKFAGLGVLNAGKGLISMLGGLPGIALTGITMAVSYFMNKNAELKQAMEQTASELEDRKKSISEFLRDNKTDSALKNGDEKEITNLIDAYKEKLKEIAPERKNAFEFGLAERKGNEERLKYLEEQLRLMREIAKESEKRLSDDDKYSSFDDAFQDAKSVSEKYSDARAKANMVMATQADFSNFNAMQDQYDEQIAIMRNKLVNELGDISKDPKLQGQASQIMSSFFDKNGWDQDVADQFRADVLNAMGVETDFYEEKFKESLSDAVNKTFPWIGDKVRNDKQLTDAENEQVRNMMKDAAAQIQKDYPNAADTLKRLLASDRFEAVIHLVFANSDDSPLSKQLGQNLTGTGETYHKKSNIQNKWKSGENDVSKIESNAKSSVDSANKRLKTATKMFKKGKLTLDLYNEAKDAYDLETSTFLDTFGYSYTGSDDKKRGKKTGSRGRKEDKALDDLKKRISLYKKMYAEIKKYKDLFGNGALGQLANDKEFEYIFKNKKLFPISDYTNYETSIKELLGTLPANTKDRVDFKNDEKAGIQSENRKLLEEQRKNELSALDKELDVIKEQYDTYKKIYELTGNKVGAQKVAFGGTVQYDTYKKFLEEQLDIAVKHDNVQSGLSYSADDIKNMSLENVKDKYGEETRVYDIRKKLEDETNKIKKETIDLMAELIEKNATISQQIDDENRSYERQLEIIKGIEDPTMRQRAKEGATKTHNENKAKLQFEQFKQESDWVTIFDDLDRVSTATIDSMVSRIDEFSRTTGLSVEVVKQLRDALDNLRKEQIERNPLPYIFGGVQRGNAIGNFIKDRIGKNASGDSQVFVSSAEGKKMGIVGNKAYTKNQLENEQQGAYDDSSKAINAFAGDMQALSNIMGPVVDLFTALGKQDSVLGKVSGGLQSGFSSAASVAGGLSSLGLSSLGPYGAAAAAGLSVASSLISAFGADYSSYNKAKEQYDNLSSIWDSLISKKTQYMSIHWGTEATEASKEAQRMLEAEIEQTRIIAQKRLDSGASAGSHSIRHRMWKGSYKYDGQNWQDVAPEISRKYGVQFNGMDDLLNMNSETLSQIKQDYVGLWANMDGDFRDYLEKLIEYGEQADDMIDNITEKLTGNKFSSLVESWGDAMSQMSNYSDNLVDNFEDNLKKTIVNSMIENLYKDKINAVLAKAKKYGDPTGGTDNITNANGDIISAFTESEYSEVMGDVEDVAKQIEATRDFLKKTYGWSDNSSSSSTNSVKGITEETADILLSYVNALRLDCSVIRAEQAEYFPEMSEIAKSQLTQLNMISQNTLRNAEAAERIESIFTSYNDNFNKVLNGTKRLNVK